MAAPSTEDDIAVSSVVDVVRSKRPEGTVLDQFETIHQRVAQAAKGSAPPAGRGNVLLAYKRPAAWGLATAAAIVGLAVWLRPEPLVDEKGKVLPVKLALVATVCAAAIAGLDVLGGRAQKT
jgi:lysozyme family protein